MTVAAIQAQGSYMVRVTEWNRLFARLSGASLIAPPVYFGEGPRHEG